MNIAKTIAWGVVALIPLPKGCLPESCAQRISPAGDITAQKAASADGGATAHLSEAQPSAARAAEARAAKVTPAKPPLTPARLAEPGRVASPSTRCQGEAGYGGTVLEKQVFARLRIKDEKIEGRYFYEHVGSDIALTGSFTNGAVSISEGKSGHFLGSCNPATGVISGTWTGTKASGGFDLAPFPRTGVAVVTEKKSLATGRVKKTREMKTCSYSESHFEIFGLASAVVEEKLNQQGIELKKRRPTEFWGDVSHCEEGFEVEYAESIELLPRDFATIVTGGGGTWESAAHPTNNMGFGRDTYDLLTGKKVTTVDVFIKSPTAAVKACFAKTTIDKELWEAIEQWDFELMPDGVKFYGSDYPHYASFLAGQGPTISYAVLLRDGYLKPDSLVRRAWDGTSPAPSSTPFCPDTKWGE